MSRYIFLYTLSHFFLPIFGLLLMLQMAGDKKGKKLVEPRAKKPKRTREDREAKQALAVAEAAERAERGGRRGSLRISEQQQQSTP